MSVFNASGLKMIKTVYLRGAGLAQPKVHAILDLGVLSSSPPIECADK